MVPALIVLIGLVTCVAPLGTAGLWDPVEVDIADLARRAAVHVLHASTLEPDGAKDLIPTVEEVGRGELPLLSMAVGLKLFGAHAWALRFPLAMWTLIGACALYWVMSRLEGRRAAWLSVLVWLTAPVVFVNARTALGEAVTMAAMTIAFAGLMLAWADERASSRRRGLAFAVGLIGLVAGFWSRGLLLGVAVPALATGLAWLVCRGSEARAGLRMPSLASAFGLTSLVVGVTATSVGAWALYRCAARRLQ